MARDCVTRLLGVYKDNGPPLIHRFQLLLQVLQLFILLQQVNLQSRYGEFLALDAQLKKLIMQAWPKSWSKTICVCKI